MDPLMLSSILALGALGLLFGSGLSHQKNLPWKSIPKQNSYFLYYLVRIVEHVAYRGVRHTPTQSPLGACRRTNASPAARRLRKKWQRLWG